MAPPTEAALRPHLSAPLAQVAGQLGSSLHGLIHDLSAVERDLQAVLADRPPGLAAASGRHLLAARGKRVRPFLCLVAARIAGRDDSTAGARALASAGELVHAATLLHDDVIDLGDERRGRPTARMVYGNAASVLGGDLLLVEALRRVEAAGVRESIVDLHSVLQLMVEAESLQLEKRGSTDYGVDDYFRICAGKTASLFEWVMASGARAGGARPAQAEALGRFGREVGVAFQLVDDVLDLTSDSESAGKSVLQDVRQGTITYPLIPALREAPELAAQLRAAVDGAWDPALGATVLDAVARHGGLEDAKRQVALHTYRARAALGELSDVPPVRVLRAVANELAERSR